MFKNSVFIVFTLLFIVPVHAQESNGTIRGHIVHHLTHAPLSGVNVLLDESVRGAASDLDGDFQIENIEPGIYNVSFEFVGFENVTKTDIIVKPDRITFINAEMQESMLESETIEVSAGYFKKDETEPVSAVDFNAEEIRRAPGSAGDISRFLKALPSAAQVADNANDMMVRGGSPMENGFLIDNIYIPNINHFPVQGASGGAIGMLNTDFIDDVKFYAGGFSAAYGDKLSSITEIKFRDGNYDEYDGQLDLSMAGVGGIIEGPLPMKKGSWFVSARRSYLDFIVDGLGLDGKVPQYGDVHAKLSLDINPKNKVTILDIYGWSAIGITKDEAVKDDNGSYGKQNNKQNTLGLNWSYFWNSSGYSNTSLSYSQNGSDDFWYDTDTGNPDQGNDYSESALRVRNRNFYQFNRSHKIEFGFEGSLNYSRFNYYLKSYTNRLGNEIPEFEFDNRYNSSSAAVFTSYNFNLTQKWLASLGVRGDYHSFNKHSHLSPRLSLTWQATRRLTFTAASGVYYQQLPLFILSQEDSNHNLKDPKAIHFVTGMEYLLTKDSRVSIELYNKDYYDFPLDPSDPSLFVVDDGTSFHYFGKYENLVDNGRARTYGIEILFQKKLYKDFYGLIGGSWFRSRYKDYSGTWRNRDYDNRYLFTFSGGYRPGSKWEVSARWNYAGGVPYTPLNLELSQEYNTSIIDESKINSERKPAYHSLNLRFDRHFNFKKSTLTIYTSIWNAYNRKNIAAYYWDKDEKKQNAIYQWSFIPLLGFEYEF
jgi:hypothetical protein